MFSLLVKSDIFQLNASLTMTIRGFPVNTDKKEKNTQEKKEEVLADKMKILPNERHTNTRKLH
jgi:hypothetical protein